mmetsp:Transcript_86611/g.279671  ORF Transcript_86611/g.279671 Transcript_86611/m.279671 type:complete len:163 (-) Transcript_86611:96-584(-)
MPRTRWWMHCASLDATTWSIFAALTNPALRLHPLNGILPEGWEQAAAFPDEVVYREYKVAYSPMVFVRSAPSAASELLGARRAGELVATTGRGLDGWVEILGGGWMLVDAERQLIGRGKGALLEPVGPPWPSPSAPSGATDATADAAAAAAAAPAALAATPG